MMLCLMRKLQYPFQLASSAHQDVPELWKCSSCALAFKGAESDFGHLIDVKVHPRPAALWLLSCAKHEYFIPDSLRAFIECQPTRKQRMVSRKNVQAFVTEYIRSEKEAGRNHAQVGLEAAAKEAGFHVRRELLREVYQQTPGVVVKPGRPLKLAN